MSKELVYPNNLNSENNFNNQQYIKINDLENKISSIVT